MLAVFDNADKNINFDGIDNKLALKVSPNQAFFKENTLSYPISDSDSNFDSNENDSIKLIFQDKNNILQYIYSYLGISSYNSSYAQKK